jgi:hypothetical protein
MAKYDLTGSLERDFTFSINGEEFTFRKPTVREMRELAKSFAGIDKEEDPDKQVELGEAAMQALYVYITPQEGGRPIAEVMEDQPVAVQVAFNEMIKAELGAK